MPTVNLSRDALFAALGQTFTDKEFENLCFEFGIELDDVTSERQMYLKERGADAKEAEKLSDEVIYKIDVAANRYDLLCLEGISRALRVFLGKEPNPEYRVVTPPQERMAVMTVQRATKGVRAFVGCAILRNMRFTEASYQSFIDLQEKLHRNVCRERRLVAIGTHDLDTLQPPFTYEALSPDDIRFRPLNEEREFTARDLFRYYKEEKKQTPLRKYLPIIETSPVYPVIYDSKRVVLSLPPIINGEHSKITLNTRNCFIECTGTDYTKVKIVLNTMVTMFSQYCQDPLSVESVEVRYEETGESHILPDLTEEEFVTSVDYINRGIGISMSGADMVRVLTRMQLPSELLPGDRLRVLAPATRSDVLHPCDIMEDVAIGYGYNRLKRTVPACNTVGRQQPLNKLSDQLREGIAQAGFTETLTFVLCSREENFAKLRREDDGSAVILENPVTRSFDIIRTTLLVGVLNTIKSNKGLQRLPLRVFELSDVALLDPRSEVGARNKRALAAVVGFANRSGFEVVHALVDRVMLLTGNAFEEELRERAAELSAEHSLLQAQLAKAARAEREDIQEALDANVAASRATELRLRTKKGVYWLSPVDNPTYLRKRCAQIMLGDGAGGGRPVGLLGTLHPEVLANFDVAHPCAALEMDVEPFV